MAVENERQVILRLVQSKQVTPEEGARLLAALGDAKATPRESAPVATAARSDDRLLKVLVEDPNGERVNLAVPLKAVPAVARFAVRWVPNEYRDAVQSAADALANDFRGDLVSVEQPNGERVRIWIE